jgi:hypothetical protein
MKHSSLNPDPDSTESRGAKTILQKNKKKTFHILKSEQMFSLKGWSLVLEIGKRTKKNYAFKIVKPFNFVNFVFGYKTRIPIPGSGFINIGFKRLVARNLH